MGDWGNNARKIAANAKVVARIALGRLAIWLIAIVIAFLPAVTAIPSTVVDYRPEAIAHQINAAGAFRDLFFVVIAASILGISNLVDNIFRHKFNFTSLFQFGAILAVLYYVLLLFYGVSHFSSSLTVGAVVPDPVFERDYWVIVFTLLVSVCVELLITFNDFINDSKTGSAGK